MTSHLPKNDLDAEDGEIYEAPATRSRARARMPPARDSGRPAVPSFKRTLEDMIGGAGAEDTSMPAPKKVIVTPSSSIPPPFSSSHSRVPRVTGDYFEKPIPTTLGAMPYSEKDIEVPKKAGGIAADAEATTKGDSGIVKNAQTVDPNATLKERYGAPTLIGSNDDDGRILGSTVVTTIFGTKRWCATSGKRKRDEDEGTGIAAGLDAKPTLASPNGIFTTNIPNRDHSGDSGIPAPPTKKQKIRQQKLSFKAKEALKPKPVKLLPHQLSPNPNPANGSLFRVPRELRDIIYAYALIPKSHRLRREARFEIDHAVNKADPRFALMRTNSTIYLEVRELLTRKVTVILPMSRQKIRGYQLNLADQASLVTFPRVNLEPTTKKPLEYSFQGETKLGGAFVRLVPVLRNFQVGSGVWNARKEITVRIRFEYDKMAEQDVLEEKMKRFVGAWKAQVRVVAPGVRVYLEKKNKKGKKSKKLDDADEEMAEE